MRFPLLIIIFLFSTNFSAQEIKLTGNISSIYKLSSDFKVKDNAGNVVQTFHREGKVNHISDNYVLIGRKYLLHQNDTMAFYKKKKIYFPLGNTVVEEEATKNGWDYFIKGNKVLQVICAEDKTAKLHKVSIVLYDTNETTMNIMRISLGKMDKRVIMDYEDDDCAWMFGVLFGILLAR